MRSHASGVGVILPLWASLANPVGNPTGTNGIQSPVYLTAALFYAILIRKRDKVRADMCFLSIR